MKKQIPAFVPLVLLLAGVSACNFTTANLSELKFGRNNKADPAVTTFATEEDIYAVATVANAPEGSYTLLWKITYDNVAGNAAGSEVDMDTVDFNGS